MRTVVIGARGQLGTDLLVRLPGEVIPLDMPELDVTRADQVRQALLGCRPAAVINCAAMTNVDECESAPAACFAVNAGGAQIVAGCAAEVGATLVYISTDYVFGAAGPRCDGYHEDEPPGPVNTYGASKLAGEHLSLAHCPQTMIVRTCGLYGHAGARGKGGNFVETMVRLGQSGRPVRVVDDQRLSPTATADCAALLVALLQAEARGIVHVAARDTCTWFELAREIFALAGLQVDLRPITSAEYNAPARRPAFSGLCSRRLAALGLPECRGWREMLADYWAQRPRTRPAADLGAAVGRRRAAGEPVETAHE